MSALQFYDLSVYAHDNATAKGTDIVVALINPANGSVITSASISNLAITGFNYTKLSDSAFQFEGDSGSALVLDWGYFVFAGTSGSTVSTSVTPSVMPYVTGATSNVQNNFAPFVMAPLTSLTPLLR